MAKAIFNRTTELKKRRILNKIADEWYGENFDKLSIDHQDEIFSFALDTDLIEWQEV